LKLIGDAADSEEAQMVILDIPNERQEKIDYLSSSFIVLSLIRYFPSQAEEVTSDTIRLIIIIKKEKSSIDHI